MACIKTGVILNSDHDGIIYGDMHLIGNCCILWHCGKNSENFSESNIHGHLTQQDINCFDRDAKPFSIYIVEAKYIKMKQTSMHELDLNLFINAGGQVIV